MPEKGRKDLRERAIDTIAAGSAEQAMLLKQDIILDALQAIRDAVDLTAAQTALTALDLEKVDLK